MIKLFLNAYAINNWRLKEIEIVWYLTSSRNKLFILDKKTYFSNYLLSISRFYHSKIILKTVINYIRNTYIPSKIQNKYNVKGTGKKSEKSIFLQKHVFDFQNITVLPVGLNFRRSLVFE